jgi:hypothetical protein
MKEGPHMSEPTIRAEDFQAPAQIESLGRIALGVGGLGLLATVIGFVVDADQFYRSYLLAYIFVLGIPMGSLALLMVHHLTGGGWGLVIRRTFEASVRTIPLMALLFLPIVFGIHTLYEWSHADVVARDPIIAEKSIYLNTTGFLIRAVLYFAIWSYLAIRLTRLSAQQDTEEVHFHRFEKVSGPGLLIFALTITFASVDWVMSLDPHWFSTLFGLWFMVGQALTALAFTITIAFLVSRDGRMKDVITTEKFHDYGKLLFAFIMLWGYLTYSQFLIIWAANLPEDIPYYLQRIGGGWSVVTFIVILGHFVLPWTLLLFRPTKRASNRLVAVAAFMLVMRFIDVFWLVAPWVKHGTFGVHWLDITAVLGLTGLWVGIFCHNLRARTLLPVGDPYLAEALADGH